MTNPFSTLIRRASQRRIYADLMRFDDHLLLDMGLTRGDISDMIAGRKSLRHNR